MVMCTNIMYTITAECQGKDFLMRRITRCTTSLKKLFAFETFCVTLLHNTHCNIRNESVFCLEHSQRWQCYHIKVPPIKELRLLSVCLLSLSALTINVTLGLP